MTPEIDPEIGEDNIRIEPGVEEEGYEIQPIALMDNGIIIFDPIEFSEKYKCDAVQYNEGVLYVLDRDTRSWHDVEKPVKAATVTKIK
jgi:hypothetical protein